MDDITVIIPTSPIRLHPSTEIIDETIASIRRQLPTSEIIIMVDGIRKEQSYLSDQYNQYKERLLEKCQNEWTNTRCKVFPRFSHQALMISQTLKEITTPLILFTEHDMPLMDSSFQWPELMEAINQGEANLIRFCMEPFIIDAWQHLMLDKTPQIICGAPMLRTVQWSQRAHLASVPFYRRVLQYYFTSSSRTFVEDAIHGKPGEDYARHNKAGWDRWKLWIYAPDGDMQRCYTTDGRKDEPKYGLIF